MHPLKNFYTPLSGATQKCFKSGPTLANDSPERSQSLININFSLEFRKTPLHSAFLKGLKEKFLLVLIMAWIKIELLVFTLR